MGTLVFAVTPIAAAQACGDEVITRTVVVGPDGQPIPVDEASADDGSNDALLVPEGLETLDAACQVQSEMLDAGADVDQPCRYTLPCGLASGGSFELHGCDFYISGVPEGGDAWLGCTIPTEYGCSNSTYTPPANGSVTFECTDCLGGVGRRPNGLLSAPSAERTAEADYFSRAAHAEAASVHAFARMREELTYYGAPAALVEATTRAIRDEERHARIMDRRARAFGAVPATPRVRKPRRRALESIARENAVEGCVRETFGALVLEYQAANATDPALRRTFARIAADETRHAALSWELAAWADTQLTPRARTRIASARRRALCDLERTIRSRRGNVLDVKLGHPDAARALALLGGLRAGLMA